MNKYTRNFLILSLLIATLLLTACNDEAVQVEGHVGIIGTDGTVLVDSNLTVDKNSLATDVISKSMQDTELTYSMTGGYFQSISDLENNQEYGWQLYVNGKIFEDSADTVTAKEQFNYELRWINYAEAGITPAPVPDPANDSADSAVDNAADSTVDKAADSTVDGN